MADPKIIQFPLGLTENLQYHYKKVEVSSAGILTLNSAPTILVVAPGAGKILIPIMFTAYYHYGGIIYITNDDLDIEHSGVGNTILSIIDILGQASDYIQNDNSSTVTDMEGGINKALVLTDTGDPTAGDGTVTIYLWYIRLKL